MLSNKFSLAIGKSIFAASIFVLTACGPIEIPNPQYPSMKGLVQSDLKQLGEESAGDIPTEQSGVRRFFEIAFGGADGASVRSFLDERIRYYLDDNDLLGAKVVPGSVYDGWNSASRTSNINKDVVEGAANLGSPNWFQGVLDGGTKTFFIPRLKLHIPLTSSRVGIVKIGRGYAPSIVINKQRIMTTPEYRQTILVHEARHSDCTGGLRQRDLANARSARDIHDFERKFTQSSCVHFHVMCPADHVLAGLPACDRHAWGAYTYGYLYATAKMGPKLSFHELYVLRYAANDSAARLLYLKQFIRKYSPENIFSGRFGFPDSSSSGVID